MSLANLKKYEENLDILMNSEAYKNADEGTKWEMGYRLMMCNSRKLNKILKVKNAFPPRGLANREV